MQILAWDTETALIRPALLAPPLVCVTWQRPGQEARLTHHAEAEIRFRDWLRDPETRFVGHNVAYDFGVVAAKWPSLVKPIFDAYRADRVTDTIVRQRLLDNAAGQLGGRFDSNGEWHKEDYRLESLAKRVGFPVKKEGFRLFYGCFRDVPIRYWVDAARALQRRGAAYLTGARDDELAAMEAILGAEKFRGQDGLLGMLAAEPNEVVTYPLDDARATLSVCQKQEAHAIYLADQFRQARAEWWLHLSSAWGLRTDPVGVEKLQTETQALFDELTTELIEAGLVRANGTRDTKAAKALMINVCAREGIPVPRTAAHASCVGPEQRSACTEHVCLDAEACKRTGDETLDAYAERSTLQKVLSNDVEALKKGTAYPIHTRYGFAETGRTTSSNPNIQNWVRARKCKRCAAPCQIHDDCKQTPKLGMACARNACKVCNGTGMLAGARECFVPRPGRVFAQADYPQLELYTLAQCCKSWLGQSALGEALNRGLDPHLAMAAQILKMPYEEAALHKKRADVDNARQTAKVANFGFPGGLGVEKLILFAKKSYGVTLTNEQAQELKRQWFAAWPEMPHYFARVNALCDNDSGRAVVETLFTKRIRGGASYCAACNNGFQALGADCAKNAGFLIAYAEYADLASPLWNSRTVAFVHDEFIIETDDGPGAHDAAHELARLMVEGANVYLPDVPIPLAKMEPLLMRRWSKKAEPRFDESGRLVPWAA